MKKFDIAILGGGPGGYVAAIRASQLGKKTVIIEKDKLGGVCLNWGCIPTKALLKSAEVLNYIKNSKQYGINVSDYNIDFSQTIKRSRDLSSRLSKGIEFLINKNKITHVLGKGKIKSNSKIIVANGDQEEEFKADKIIIATGSTPRSIPGEDFDGRLLISSKDAMILKSPPEKLIIIGAGAIGVEFAYFFNEYGSEVHLVEMMPNLLPNEDKDISKELEKHFKNSGIKVYTNSRVSKFQKLKNKVKVTISQGENLNIIQANKALVAVGINGNILGLGLEGVGIKTHRNSIVINEFNQTSIPNIYAIGDVSGPPWLAHVASAQGNVAAEHASGYPTNPIDYNNIPGCTYCHPQVASLGLTEKSAKELGLEVKVGKFDFKASGKAVASGNTVGFVKLIFDAKYGEIIGAHIIGEGATEMIAELGIAKTLESTWHEITATVHAHPTLSEAIMEATLNAMEQGVHQ